jgi:hypothetical protein
VLHLIGSVSLNGQEVKLLDNTGLFPISKLVGLNNDFYGGRVTKYGYIKSNPDFIMLVEEHESDGMKIIDICTEKVKALPRDILKYLLNCKKIKYRANMATEELVDLYNNSFSCCVK